jgi:hypothetical protein
MLYTTPPSY